MQRIIGNDVSDMISETNHEASFSLGQFKILNFSTPIRFVCDQYGGGLYIREDVPAKYLYSESTKLKVYWNSNLKRIFQLNFTFVRKTGC